MLVRLLGGVDYWRYGVDQLAAAARAQGVALAIVPGDRFEDARLDAASTLPVADLRALWRYFEEGGPDNLAPACDSSPIAAPSPRWPTAWRSAPRRASDARAPVRPECGHLPQPAPPSRHRARCAAGVDRFLSLRSSWRATRRRSMRWRRRWRRAGSTFRASTSPASRTAKFRRRSRAFSPRRGST